MRPHFAPILAHHWRLLPEWATAINLGLRSINHERVSLCQQINTCLIVLFNWDMCHASIPDQEGAPIFHPFWRSSPHGKRKMCGFLASSLCAEETRLASRYHIMLPS